MGDAVAALECALAFAGTSACDSLAGGVALSEDWGRADEAIASVNSKSALSARLGYSTRGTVQNDN